jgi:hypothetical protein
MNKDEALRLAIESLCCVRDMVGHPDNLEYIDHQVAKIEAALEAKVEPVAFVETKEVHGQMCSFIYRADSTKLLPDGTKLYITPQQRTWVGLTDQEIWTVLQFRGYSKDNIEIAKAIEVKLKEKNSCNS